LGRFEVRIEARAAAKNSSLVNDNIQQRRSNLKPQLLAHERARTFYMPDFMPPPMDLPTTPEHTLLYLPSALSKGDLARVCSRLLIKAEEEVRMSSMATGIEDLIRQLITRTFLHRHRVQNLTGVYANTRARDSIGFVSRRVDAEAGAYRRHRAAYKRLAGPARDGWEKIFKPLLNSDVRGLSEKALLDEEVDARYRATKLAEALAAVTRTERIQKENEDVDGDAEVIEDDEGDDKTGLVSINTGEVGTFTEALAPGEGCLKISWIWVAGLQLHDGKGTQLTDGALDVPLRYMR
jgi:hypothetical protein